MNLSLAWSKLNTFHIQNCWDFYSSLRPARKTGWNLLMCIDRQRKYLSHAEVIGLDAANINTSTLVLTGTSIPQ